MLLLVATSQFCKHPLAPNSQPSSGGSDSAHSARNTLWPWPGQSEYKLPWPQSGWVRGGHVTGSWPMRGKFCASAEKGGPWLLWVRGAVLHPVTTGEARGGSSQREKGGCARGEGRTAETRPGLPPGPCSKVDPPLGIPAGTALSSLSCWAPRLGLPVTGSSASRRRGGEGRRALLSQACGPRSGSWATRGSAAARPSSVLGAPEAAQSWGTCPWAPASLLGESRPLIEFPGRFSEKQFKLTPLSLGTESQRATCWRVLSGQVLSLALSSE